MKQQLGTCLVKRYKPDLIQDQKITAGDLLLKPRQRACMTSIATL